MKKFNKIITLVLIITFFFSPVLANKAEAGIPVIDYTNIAKEYGLDGIAGMIINTIIERMTKSVVDWINSGFKGGPGFVENPGAFFGNIGNQVAGQYILNNPNLNFLCGPISAKIKLALTTSYNQNNVRWQCTLTEVGKNMEDFMNNFENGGWDSFFEITQTTHMNPIGAYLQAESELYLQINSREGQQKEELLQNGGFLSHKVCKPGTEVTPADKSGLGNCGTAYNSCIRWANGDPTNVESERQKCSATYKSCSSQYAGVEVGDCAEKNKETVTPGSVISEQLNNQLSIGQDKLAVADELNEIVSALLNQLIKGVVGGIGKGLRGLSQPDSEGQIFTDQLNNTTAASTTDYFGNVQDTSILNVPLPGPSCDPTSPFYNPADPACTAP